MFVVFSEKNLYSRMFAEVATSAPAPQSENDISVEASLPKQTADILVPRKINVLSNTISSSGPEERIQQYQESINRKVLLEWVRVTGLPNPRKRSFDRLLNELATEILK